jgi:hypothetical protein
LRVVGDDELALPDYGCNGMFKSLGNVLVNPAVGLLFIDIGEKPRRLRVNGAFALERDKPQISSPRQRGGSLPVARLVSRAARNFFSPSFTSPIVIIGGWPAFSGNHGHEPGTTPRMSSISSRPGV